MTRKKFIYILSSAITKPEGLAIYDATTRHGKPHSGIYLHWAGTTQKTEIKIFRGTEQDNQNISKELAKYKGYLEQFKKVQ